MKINKARTYRVASLFCGCGGGDLGFLGGFEYLGLWYPRLPFEVVWANDIDMFACKVFEAGLGDHVHAGDISYIEFDTLGIGEIDVVIGGFPCQEFSLRGPRGGLGTARGRMYTEMRRAIEFFRPKIFLAENVPGIEYPPATLRTIMRDLGGRSEPRYRVRRYAANAADYGVPQIRSRILIVGLRSDLPQDFPVPRSVRQNPLEQVGDLQPWLTARDALEDLWDPRGPSDSTVADQGKLTRATIVLGTQKRRDRRLNGDAPAPIVRAEHHGHIEVHYGTQVDGSVRRLTIRECARLQSFPDSFEFPVSATQAYKQIGNAIPPVMMHHWAKAAATWLGNGRPRARKKRDRGMTSRIMSAVKSRGSKAETLLGRQMWSLGLRYRKHPKGILGKPDYAFIGPKVAVFCDGDFWHGIGWGERGFRSWDEQFEGLHNAELWREKIARNMERDRQVNVQLEQSGWLVLRLLESEILRDSRQCAHSVLEAVRARKEPASRGAH